MPCEASVKKKFKFNRELRIQAQDDFQNIFRSAKRVYLPPLVIHYQPNGLANSRLGLSVSKKRLRAATQRNKVKRWLREAFRTRPALSHQFDFVVKLSFHEDKPEFKSVTAALEKLWRKLNVS